MMQAIPVPAFRDNYIWLFPVPAPDIGPARVAIVDPGQAEPVLDTLERTGLEPAAILITHHHPDHTGGIQAVLRRHRIPVYGPASSPAGGIDRPLRDGDTVRLDDTAFRVLAVPGHTLDHIAYHTEGALLCGDTLYAGGCGRLFEGSPEQMHKTLKRLSLLPDETRIFCAHEYTVRNLEFAAAVEPGNEAVRARLEAARRLRAQGRPTLPSTLAEERLTNPFLRCAEPAVIEAARRRHGGNLQKEHEVFAVIRGWRDIF